VYNVSQLDSGYISKTNIVQICTYVLRSTCCLATRQNTKQRTL